MHAGPGGAVARASLLLFFLLLFSFFFRVFLLVLIGARPAGLRLGLFQDGRRGRRCAGRRKPQPCRWRRRRTWRRHRPREPRVRSVASDRPVTPRPTQARCEPGASARAPRRHLPHLASRIRFLSCGVFYVAGHLGPVPCLSLFLMLLSTAPPRHYYSISSSMIVRRSWLPRL